jgi:prephenate dehydrogenase
VTRLATPVFDRVALLGVGMIGGSVAAACRVRGATGRITGYTPQSDAREALELGLIDAAAGSVAEAVRDADLVILAAPISAQPALFTDLLPHLRADALITDCASTKASTVAAARERLGPAFARYVPSHPIAGSERHGPQAARADLFNGAMVIVCPQPENSVGSVARIRDLWSALGARVVELDAPRHDRVFAEVSHWPHAVVFAMCSAIANGGFSEDALRFAGAGLRDSSRIGASSPQLWADILLDNREPVLECARAFEVELAALLAALKAGDRVALAACFEPGSRWRQALKP